jgi:flagellar hook-associated protein 1 FlgK
MSFFFPLAIAREALLAHQRALGVVGHNIANVNTPGFSRQRAELGAITLGDRVGAGVRVVDVRQAIDPFLEARQLASASALAAATTSRDLLDRVQGLFPVQGPGIGDALHEFFAAADALATHPQEVATRSELLGRAESLAGRLRSTAAALATMQHEADGQIAQAGRDANSALATIAQLNRNIVVAEVSGGTANDLRDARRVALERVAELLQVNVIEQGDGSVSVFAASGATLVAGPDAATLATEVDPMALGLDGNPLSRIGLRDAGGSVIALGGALGGTIGALVIQRDQRLPATAADLDRFATTLRDAVNAVQTDPAGRDLDGLVGAPLFTGSGAADLTVAITDPRAIAAARSANPGDNAGALALVAVGDATFAALGGVTLTEFFGTVQASAGDQARRADDQATIEESVASALAAQRDAFAGVNLEEEFTDLIRFQRSFQAAAQLISVSNRMLDDLLGMLG